MFTKCKSFAKRVYITLFSLLFCSSAEHKPRARKGYTALFSLLVLSYSLPAIAVAAENKDGEITPSCKYANKVLPTINDIASGFLGLGLAVAVPICVALAGLLIAVAAIPTARKKIIEALSTTAGISIAMATFGVALLTAIIGLKCGAKA